LRRPLRLLKGMARDIIASRELAWRLFVRDTSIQYRQTVFGYFWAVFPPLVTSMVFILMNHSNLLKMKETGIPYPVYVVMGTVFFGLFSDSLMAPLKVVNGSKTMLVKINFPREALVWAAILQTFMGFSIKLVLLILTMIIFHVPVKITSFIVPVPLLGLLLMGITIGVFLVPFGILFQDVMYGLQLALTGLMFLTPVVYPPPSNGLLAKIVAYNPMTTLLMSARDFMIKGSSIYVMDMMIVIIIMILLLFIAWVIIRIAFPIVIERIGT